MVKAIIFDCFGVLTTEAWLPFKAKYFGDNSELFEQASAIAKQANAGVISHTDFMAQAAKLAGISTTEATNYIQRNVADEQLFDYLAELKKDYKLGFLSNIAGDYLDRMFNAEQLGLFDEIILSYQSGHIKPELEAFENAAEQLGVEIESCVMVDDQERNVTGAREAGMQAILYTDFDAFKPELESLTRI